MRKDFIKVLTERPRAGGNRNAPNLERLDNLTRNWEDYDETGALNRNGLGRKKRYWRDSKEFTDLLSPLKRYIASNVGRPWDDVYSEICATLKANSVQGNHLREHVSWMVDSYAEFVERVAIYGEDSPYRDSWYVDADGILRSYPFLTRAQRRKSYWGYMLKSAFGLSEHPYLENHEKLFLQMAYYISAADGVRRDYWYVFDKTDKKKYYYNRGREVWIRFVGENPFYHVPVGVVLSSKDATKLGLKKAERTTNGMES